MRLCWVITALALGTGGGCQLYKQAAHNLLNETAFAIDRSCHKHRVRKWAEEVWGSVAANCPEWASDDAFREGFIDGYSDYLLYGGGGQPPPIPPSKYRRYKDLSPEGIAAIESWKAGFVNGALVARDHSRDRTWLTVPIEGGFSQGIEHHPPVGPGPADPGPVQLPQPTPVPGGLVDPGDSVPEEDGASG